jgi:hypothetical protein
MIGIFVDFNYSTKLLPLRFKGSFEDIRKQNVELQEGMHITLYDDMYQAAAVVEKIQEEWWARVTGKITNIPESSSFTLVSDQIRTDSLQWLVRSTQCSETRFFGGKPVHRRWELPLMFFVIADMVTPDSG